MAEASLDDARELAGAFAVFDRARRLLGQRSSLGTADMRLLWLFTDGRPRSLRQIAADLGLEQSTVNRQVNAAMKAGLLVRDRVGNGPYEFTTSATGAAEFTRNVDVTLDSYRDALEAMGDDREVFLNLITKYVEAYSQAVTAG